MRRETNGLVNAYLICLLVESAVGAEEGAREGGAELVAASLVTQRELGKRWKDEVRTKSCLYRLPVGYIFMIVTNMPL